MRMVRYLDDHASVSLRDGDNPRKSARAHSFRRVSVRVCLERDEIQGRGLKLPLLPADGPLLRQLLA